MKVSLHRFYKIKYLAGHIPIFGRKILKKKKKYVRGNKQRFLFPHEVLTFYYNSRSPYCT